MHTEQIETLLEKYYNGETSLEEESQLEQFFSHTKLLPDHLKPHAVQFQVYGQEKEVELDKYLSEDWLFEKIENPARTFKATSAAPKKNNFFQQYYWQMAAGISLLLAAFWGVNYYRDKGFTASGSPEVVALQQEVREMKQVLASTSSVNGASASDRIRVVSQEFNTQDFSSAENQEVTRLLMKTMTSDENVNVRLAACEALFQFKEEPAVRKAYIQALGQEKNPLMQLALIEVVTHLKEKKAVPQLQKLANQENLLPIVKLKAQEGLGTLI
ncbi:HEAT repeat domain-containing protein [Rufibacter sp. LB8]|uniref:HEAT repeat domain-containing protein n=1 Tax=Rufibacter sp. LB8 TaxID=2777781 RepID=UPI00178C5789|nr:HEAT repeat domain-containing protein [Rufibacter sp. LB8]